jgi:hypothetical protein
LLGTPENDDNKFIEALENDDRNAKEKLRKLLDEQSDPERAFYDSDGFKNNVPAWTQDTYTIISVLHELILPAKKYHTLLQAQGDIGIYTGCSRV